MTKAIEQNLRLADESVEGMRGVCGCGSGEEVEVEGFVDDAGPGDGVGDDDLFDLGLEFGRGGGEELVGGVVGDEGGDVDGGAAGGADEGFGWRC